MKKISITLICLILMLSSAVAEDISFRFADADEAAALLMSNEAYYGGMNQADLDFRLQRTGGTLDDLRDFAAAQTLDFTEAERTAVDAAMQKIEVLCAERGYILPPMDDIVFAKTTMREECGAEGYTHGAQIYLSAQALAGAGGDAYFHYLIAHELFHCLTRAHPDFRAAMYGILGFTVAGADFDFAPSIRAAMISNPDVDRHDAFAAFDIDGQTRDCAVVFITQKPFTQPGDTFFDGMATGLVPIDDLSTLYSAEDAANFWDVFGKNTGYVIDPEETLADNFAFTLLQGLGGNYPSPGIIEAIDARLKTGGWQ